MPTPHPTTYRVRVKGHLGPEWSAWFDGLAITNLPHGVAELAGPLADQAALHGVLLKVRDLGLPLLSVTTVRPARHARPPGRGPPPAPADGRAAPGGRGAGLRAGGHPPGH
jgi:hypothetical protein